MHSFDWNDTTFKTNARRRVKILRAFDGPPCPNLPCYKYAENSKTYDTIMDFLERHPTIKIEILVLLTNEDLNNIIKKVYLYDY